jgi:hypothetical protein
MLVTEHTREGLRLERFRRDMEARGYEKIGEGGGKLWELYRGWRTDQRIVDAIVDPGGRAIWIKTEKVKDA